MTRWSAALLLVPSLLSAQAPVVRVVISDSLGNRVPFAVVQVDAQTRRVASDSGVVLLELPAADSIKLSIRRIGFAPFEGWAKLTVDGVAYDVRLAMLPQALKEVQIRSVSENRLFRSGFYQRMEDQLKISTRSEFFTPEDMDRRNAQRMTDVLRGVSFIRIERTGFGDRHGGAVMGRGRCMANILVDGHAPVWTLEDATAESDQAGSFAGRSRGARPSGRGEGVPLDALLAPGVVTGFEVYASADGAPIELRAKAKRPTCPLVAIWTGPRR